MTKDDFIENKICAGIVTYNPDIIRLKENIEAVNSQINIIFIFDNGSTNINEILDLTKKNTNVIVRPCKQNKGIAFALNRLVELAKEHGFEWILTLDQDSVILEGLIEQYVKYIDRNNTGLICCTLEDRNFKGNPFKVNGDYEIVKKCITSGTLTNISCVYEVGGFDEDLFIDSVDYDMCYSMAEKGYDTIMINFCGLLHEVGKSRTVNLFGKKMAVNNHNPMRKYYIARNSVYLIKKHKLNKFKEYFVIYRRFFTVLFFEKQKKEKISAMFRGIRDGKRMAKKFIKKGEDN